MISPAQVGELFCLSRVTGDMGPIEGMLTPSLEQAIDTAIEKDIAWGAANPGEKPPLGDGIPWQAWPDYAPDCTVGEVANAAADEATVPISYAFPDAPDANFTDTLHVTESIDVRRSIPVWRIDNVQYATGGDLKAFLASAFSN